MTVLPGEVGGVLRGNACLALLNNQEAEKEASANALGAKGGRDSVISLPESLGCCFSSHFSSFPQFTFISLCHSSQNRETNHLPPCSFLPGLFAFATSRSTTVVYVDIWVCCYFYEEENQSKHSVLLNSKTRKHSPKIKMSSSINEAIQSQIFLMKHKF